MLELAIYFVFTVNCAPGNYLSSSTCAPCEFDHFQDQQGQTSCKPCPNGSTTNGSGARSLEECIFEGIFNMSECIHCIYFC